MSQRSGNASTTRGGASRPGGDDQSRKQKSLLIVAVVLLLTAAVIAGWFIKKQQGTAVATVKVAPFGKAAWLKSHGGAGINSSSVPVPASGSERPGGG